MIEAIGLTPFSREELGLASLRQTEGITELERARRFFVCARQVRTGRIVNNEGVRQRVELICRNIRNKALSRLI